MNDVVAGYVLALLTCFGSEYNCEIKQVTPEIYSTESGCEWELKNQAHYYPADKLHCAEVRRAR